MDAEMFQKAVDEIGIYGVNRLTLHLMGEPLLHPKIFDMVAYAKTKEKIQMVDFSTNGALLTEKNIEGAIRSGLDVINVDMDGATAKTYEDARKGLKFETTVHNVKNLIEAVHASEKQTPRVKLQVIQTPAIQAEMDLFWELWNPVLEGKTCVDVYQKKYEWWSGAKPDDVDSDAHYGTPGPLFVHIPCGMLERQMNVFWNGEVNHCCLDTNGDLKIGDFREQSLMEIWHSDAAQKLRRLVRGRSYTKIHPCNGCIRSTAKRFFSFHDLTNGTLKRFAKKFPKVFDRK